MNKPVKDLILIIRNRIFRVQASLGVAATNVAGLTSNFKSTERRGSCFISGPPSSIPNGSMSLCLLAFSLSPCLFSVACPSLLSSLWQVSYSTAFYGMWLPNPSRKPFAYWTQVPAQDPKPLLSLNRNFGHVYKLLRTERAFAAARENASAIPGVWSWGLGFRGLGCSGLWSELTVSFSALPFRLWYGRRHIFPSISASVICAAFNYHKTKLNCSSCT